MKLDLHVHTTSSDGAWSAAEVVAGAVRGGLDVIAIADHDSTGSIADARVAARDERIEVVGGIEVSTTHDGRELHVLGYFVDPEAPALVAHGGRAVTLRADRMREIVARLASEGVHVPYEDVERAAGPKVRAIGRPHLARALVEHGHATSIPDAFDRLIGDARPAFVPTGLATPAEGIGLILAAGGIPVWAHPPADALDALLPELVVAGLRGLEVHRPSHSPGYQARLARLCRTEGLLASGGSDWHSPDGGTELGAFFVTGEAVEGLLRAGGM